MDDDFKPGDRVCSVTPSEVLVLGTVSKVYKETCFVKWDDSRYSGTINKQTLKKGEVW